MADLRHCGMGWPNGAVDNETIASLPTDSFLMLATEGRYHYDWLRNRRPDARVLWRAIPRIGKRPAELGWSPARFVAETINLTDAPSEPITDFIPWNELDLCLLGDQLVTARRPTAATMRWYEGDIVTIKTASGKQVTATANHPILTRHGWLLARDVKEGMEVAENTRGRLLPNGLSFRSMGVAADGFDDIDVPTPISEVFRTLNKKGVLSRREVVTHDLNSNGRYGYVDVVRPHRFLRRAITQFGQKRRLVATGVRDQSFSAQSAAVPLLHRDCATLQNVRLIPSPRFGDDSSLRSTRDVFNPGAPLLRSLSLHPQHGGLSVRSNRQAAPLEDLQQVAGAVAGDGIGRFTGAVTFVQVTDLIVSQFSGHVYGLTTEDNVILADSIITHNSNERGDSEDDWAGLDRRYALIGGWGVSVVHMLKQWSPGTRIHWPAFTPDHDAFNYLHAWSPAAGACDVVDFHAYDSLDKIETAYHNLRLAFPGKPLALTEWHCKGDQDEERRVLGWMAETMADDPFFETAYFFIWRWHGAPGWWSDAWDVEHSLDRLKLFRNPPTVPLVPPPAPKPEPPPMTRDQIISLIVAKAKEAGVEPVELLGGAIAESNLDPSARRPADPSQDQTYWPDVSFGLFQQTAKFSDEGDHSPRPDNIRFVEELYSDPAHATDVATAKFKGYRAQETNALDAWCRYNWPSKAPAENPNRANYARGLDEAGRILGATPPAPAARVAYNRDQPVIPQDDPWSCAPTSARWALTAVGRHPTEGWFEQQIVADGIASEADGLEDASGAGLADWITKEYGEFGYSSNAESPVSFDALAAEFAAPANPYPGLLGGSRWGHWSGLRGYDPATDCLMLANPADGWHGVHQTMTRGQFDDLGPFSLVRVLHPDLLDSQPTPPPPPAPSTWRDDLAAELARHQQAVEAILAGAPS